MQAGFCDPDGGPPGGGGIPCAAALAQAPATMRTAGANRKIDLKNIVSPQGFASIWRVKGDQNVNK
jgi:hypothetical protein